MAEGTPDLSKIIKLIMDNPKLIEEIGEMMKRDDNGVEELTAPDKTPKPEAPVISEAAKESKESKSRRDLLYALKPYLSEKRSHAIDSMLSVAEVFAMLRR